MSKLQLPEGTFPNAAVGMPKPNSRCSSPPSVAVVPYMEGFICKRRSCTLQVEGLEIKFTHFILTVAREPCTQNECGTKHASFLKQKIHLA